MKIISTMSDVRCTFANSQKKVCSLPGYNFHPATSTTEHFYKPTNLQECIDIAYRWNVVWYEGFEMII
jgi:hypothetical protein